MPDLAESWTISADGLVYTLKLRQGVRFHDGSVITSRDVKASYDKIVFPPPETSSYRKGQYRAVPGTQWATPPAELEKLAGYWRDIKASRAEARRLLREARIADGFSFTFKNRGIPQPYEPLGIWLIDQWKQIGLNVRQETNEASAHHPMLQRGDFDVAMDFQCSFMVEPDLDIDTTPRSASGTCARSRSGCSTRRSTTSTRCRTTGSSRTAPRCGAGRSRPATS